VAPALLVKRAMNRFVTTTTVALVIQALAPLAGIGAGRGVARADAPVFSPDEIRSLTHDLRGEVLVASWQDASRAGLLDEIAMTIGKQGIPITAQRQALAGDDLEHDAPAPTEAALAVRLCTVRGRAGVVIVGTPTAVPVSAGPRLAVYACGAGLRGVLPWAGPQAATTWLELGVEDPVRPVPLATPAIDLTSVPAPRRRPPTRAERQDQAFIIVGSVLAGIVVTAATAVWVIDNMASDDHNYPVARHVLASGGFTPRTAIAPAVGYAGKF
jgi:hypothetical protein